MRCRRFTGIGRNPLVRCLAQIFAITSFRARAPFGNLSVQLFPCWWGQQCAESTLGIILTGYYTCVLYQRISLLTILFRYLTGSFFTARLPLFVSTPLALGALFLLFRNRHRISFVFTHNLNLSLTLLNTFTSQTELKWINTWTFLHFLYLPFWTELRRLHHNCFTKILFLSSSKALCRTVRREIFTIVTQAGNICT